MRNPLVQAPQPTKDNVAPEVEIKRLIMYTASVYTSNVELSKELYGILEIYEFSSHEFAKYLNDLLKLYFPFAESIKSAELKDIPGDAALGQLLPQFVSTCLDEYQGFNKLECLIFNAAKDNDLFPLDDFYGTNPRFNPKSYVNNQENPLNLFFRRDKYFKSPVDYALLSNNQDFLDFVFFLTNAPTSSIKFSNHVTDSSLQDSHLKIIFNRMTAEDYKDSMLPANVEKYLTDNKATPLHFAAMFGNIDAVVNLKELGADLTAKDINGRTPLHYAAMHNQANIVSLLVHRGIKNAADSNGKTALAYAAEQGFSLVIKKLIRAGAIDVSIPGHFTAMHLAVINHHPKCVEALLSAKNPSVNVSVGIGTPLHYALEQRTEAGDKCAVAILTAPNVKLDVNVPGQNNKTVLHIAVARNDYTFAGLIVAKNPNFTLKDDIDGHTPTQQAKYHASTQINELINCAILLQKAENMLEQYVDQNSVELFEDVYNSYIKYLATDNKTLFSGFWGKKTTPIESVKLYKKIYEVYAKALNDYIDHFKEYLKNLSKKSPDLYSQTETIFISYFLPELLTNNSALKLSKINIQPAETVFELEELNPVIEQVVSPESDDSVPFGLRSCGKW